MYRPLRVGGLAALMLRALDGGLSVLGGGLSVLGGGLSACILSSNGVHRYPAARVIGFCISLSMLAIQQCRKRALSLSLQA